jgi:hypothetical protein
MQKPRTLVNSLHKGRRELMEALRLDPPAGNDSECKELMVAMKSTLEETIRMLQLFQDKSPPSDADVLSLLRTTNRLLTRHEHIKAGIKYFDL